MWKKRLIKFSLIVVVLAFGILYFMSQYHYSEGSRTGYLTKFIKVGFVFKTYEGEIYIGGATADNNSLVNNVWNFSAPENTNNLIDSLEKYEGSVVKVYYHRVLKNMPWQGETVYFADKVEFVREK